MSFQVASVCGGGGRGGGVRERERQRRSEYIDHKKLPGVVANCQAESYLFLTAAKRRGQDRFPSFRYFL